MGNEQAVDNSPYVTYDIYAERWNAANANDTHVKAAVHGAVAVAAKDAQQGAKAVGAYVAASQEPWRVTIKVYRKGRRLYIGRTLTESERDEFIKYLNNHGADYSFRQAIKNAIKEAIDSKNERYFKCKNTKNVDVALAKCSI